jgi:hypothetical protein
MRDVTELTEDEAELVNRLIEAYPAALSYEPDRDPPVHAIAKEVIEEGRVERKEIDDGDPETGAPIDGILIAYRLTDEHAEEIRRSAAEKAKGAGWN